ncbi:hypothetical protein CRV01_08580 [Arcobacter sp. CECT 8983]|uniref:gamma-glutamyl-gamma-aminobutyrate hydrolase family protein n=1 Tax=Arcobacter sp. CECT 8983 TaxID=2044508 RepID=UPI00100C2497|nr:gamma-glutamyl-gamma-aminobutyrate hydrolase family protein [Arcobacter sp. CECT 8983]RXJ89521.1 hypothetical protein CRV01_08580 [Arcobacter sp. CECT 8983]
MAKPLVGICLPDKGNFFAYLFIKLNLKLQKASCVRLRPSKKNIDFKKLDGLILSGGSDIDPTLYGANKDAHNTKLDKKRDAFELEMIDKAYKEELPILGICRGAQLINIYFEGNLYAKILDLDEYLIHQNSIFPIKEAKVKKDTTLHSAVEEDEIVINSIHNQAIHKVGKDLEVSSKHESIIESVEKKDYPFLLALQWHPEYLIYLKKHRNIFKKFIKACINYKSD